MRKQSLNDLIEYRDTSFHPKVLINEPGYRMILMSIRAGQIIPEHATRETVTVYVVTGSITFSEGAVDCELHAGDVVTVNPGSQHKVHAHEDSALLVLATGKPAEAALTVSELDLREVPRPLRHPLVFRTFDTLALNDTFLLINDHDPIPLNLQMESMRPGQARWEYIERGPETFRIRVSRVAANPGVAVPA